MTSLIPVFIGLIFMATMLTAQGKKNREEYYKQINTLSAETVEYVRGIPVVKTFGQSVESFKRLYTSIIVMKDSVLKMTMGYRNKMSMFEATSGSTAFFLVPAALFIIAAGENPHEVVADSIIYFLIGPIFGVLIMRTATISQYLYFAELALDKIEDILEYDEMAYGKEDQTTGGIEFKNVSFKYPDGNDYVLKDISFTAKKGETVAIIGSTGSGKSSLINLIPRFFDATEGEVLVDGINIKDYSQEFLHNKLGYVPQRAVMFSGSVNYNVSYGDNGDKKASEDEVKKAVEIAQGKEFVEKMPEQYNAFIAQGGTNISGGQKQRLAIARAIARNPEIYIFDDSFSALDYKTDFMLRNELKKYTKDATMIIVAQRIGTILNADKILVLENGECVGLGTHKELLKNCKVYQEIAYSQLSKEELENG